MFIFLLQVNLGYTKSSTFRYCFHVTQMKHTTETVPQL